MLGSTRLTRRFGALYLLFFVVLAVVCAVVLLYLRGMRLDSERVMEEAREQAVLTRVQSGVHVLKGLFPEGSSISSSTTDGAVLDPASEILQQSLLDLGHLAGHEDDPSREEHEAEEGRMVEEIERELVQVGEFLSSASFVDELGLIRDSLTRAEALSESLAQEAIEEAVEANANLERRALATSRVMLFVLFCALTILGSAWFLIHRQVVRPLRDLSRGVERFGRGELAHRIDLEGHDEITDLATTFNDMAAQIEDVHGDLETRIAERTAEFLRAARLADLGLLASGIAHEINTPLASITTAAEGLSRRLPSPKEGSDDLQPYTDIIVAEAFRARDITQRMLALVRHEPSAVAKTSLSRVLDQVQRAVRFRAEKKDCQITVSSAAGDDYYYLNEGELTQILANLMANAVDACCAGGEARLEARLEADQLVFSVIDNGSGINAENRKRLFDPFFTTKPSGEGTGLGLALVATLVEHRDGKISVRSEIDEGSRFDLRLPVDWRKST